MTMIYIIGVRKKVRIEKEFRHQILLDVDTQHFWFHISYYQMSCMMLLENETKDVDIC